MNDLDLFALRETYHRQRIMLCFNGPISRSLIEEIGNALRNYLQREQAHPSEALDVFSVYIEMTQNIRHYASARGYDEYRSAATVVIGRNDAGRYMVSAGNVVDRADGERLIGRIGELCAMDKAELKAAYKTALRAAKPEGAASGAGLGLIDMARKASEPMDARLRELDAQHAFFSLQVVI
ncbi:biofilm regulation protein kinase SiaB [Panacagrimonas sp.]|uniref:biofilm regulation protein kinase SiaB n=1 Tax=Panacagrimonas sp. TaxID=2480088 RepID=UPI003B52AD12